MTGIVIIISSLCIVCVVCQELKLISELNNFFNFDHNIFLFDASAHLNRFITTEIHGTFTPQTLYVLESVDGNITGLDSLTEVKSKNTFMVVVHNSANIDLFTLLK